MSSELYDADLDVIGLKCPLPILKAKKALAQLSEGQVLHILTNDASAPDDFTAFCNQTGHQLLALIKREDDVFEMTIRHR